MKRILVVLATCMLGMALHAQTLTLPAPTSTAVAPVAPSWTPPVAGNGYVACTAAFPCTYNLYALAGACPGTLVGSSGWKLLTPAGFTALTFSDAAETPGSQVSYVVYAVGPNGAIGPPSNCSTITVPVSPLVPGPPVLTGF
jgi:hypothetical protein